MFGQGLGSLWGWQLLPSGLRPLHIVRLLPHHGPAVRGRRRTDAAAAAVLVAPHRSGKYCRKGGTGAGGGLTVGTGHRGEGGGAPILKAKKGMIRKEAGDR